FIHILRPHIYTLFPYTTLFRSAGRFLIVAGYSYLARQYYKRQLNEVVRQHQEDKKQRADATAKEAVKIAQAVAKEKERKRESKRDRKSTRLNSSHVKISYAVFC